MTTWVYVDESKRAGYVLAATAVADPEAARKVVRGLIVPGRRRLHMHNETARRRLIVVSTLTAMPLAVRIYDAARRYPTEHEARAACLAALVEDLADSAGDTHVVIERDDSLVRADQTVLYRAIRRAHRAGLPGAVHYDHQLPHEDLLLALPDVAAWCWVRSAEWRRRIGPILTSVCQV